MAWETPIYDRNINDVLLRNDKGFFNVSDWNRIYYNEDYIQNMIATQLGFDISLDSIPDPDTTTIPTAESINTLVNNIEKLRIASALPLWLGARQLFHGYTAGEDGIVPTWREVNDWEISLLFMFMAIPRAGYNCIHCGVAAVGQPRLWQGRFRGSI